jgi:hypothetical protein
MKTKKIICASALLITAMLFSCEKFSHTEASEAAIVKTYELIGEVATPEGISIDQRNGNIYTGSMRDGSMQVTTDGKSKYFIQPGSGILLPNVLGSKVDEKNNRIWVCSNDFSKSFSGTPTARVSVLNISNGTLVKQFDEKAMAGSTEGVFAFVNDIILDKSGNAYVSNSGSNTVFKISADCKEVKVLAKNFPAPPTGKKYSLNGIEISQDGKYLITNTFIMGEADAAALFRIDIQTGEVKLIDFTEQGTTDFSKTAGDGLLMLDKSTLLCLSIASTVLKIELDKDLTSAVITNISNGTDAQEQLVGSATLAQYKNRIYTTNAQGGALFNPSIVVQKPYKIIEIPEVVLGL